MSTTPSYCRFCHAFCGIEVELEGGRAVQVRGDKLNPMSEGYTCIKGRALPEQHAHPSRLLRHQKRNGDGSFSPVSLDDACHDIAERLQGIIAEHGPRAVALYGGTAAYQNASALSVGRAWITALGSPSFYSSLTIDQPNKLVAPQLHGGWMGGTHSFATSDVWMVFGCNSIVSMYGGTSGFPSFNPTRRVRDAKRRGLDLIVVDPRRSELAKMADLHLPVRPGEDAVLIAGMLRVILDEGLEDADFVAQWTNGRDALARAVAGFTNERVERRTGVEWAKVEEAARRFARGARGLASSGTGPSMAPHPNLSEYLIHCLNSLCGRVNRAGDVVANPGTLMPERSAFEGAVAPVPGFRMGAQSRIRGLGQIAGELPTAALSDEILTPGEGRVRALIVLGGNPMMAWPDQLKTTAALDALELLVVVDPFLGETARRADYVIAPKLSLERADVTTLMDTWWPEAYAMYTPPVADPPLSSEAVDEWAFIWELAARMGTEVTLPGGPLPLDRRPDTDEVLDLVTARARVALDEVRRHPHGARFPGEQPTLVAPNEREPKPALALAAAEMMDELGALQVEIEEEERAGPARPAFSHRLISRRLREVCNSVGRELPSLRARRPYNPAFMHPDDLDALGLVDGQHVEIESSRASVRAIVEASDDVRPGVISMAHAWGGAPDRGDDVEVQGTSTARLVDNAREYDPIAGMPRQSAIPVNVRPA
jgi:anaerobic selenocysteine-containing dehydrogenase